MANLAARLAVALALMLASSASLAAAQSSCETGDTWSLVLRHNTVAGFFENTDGLLNINNTEAPLFSRLAMIEDFRSPLDGRFYFKLRWPGLCSSLGDACPGGKEENIWSQSSNPMSASSVVGFNPLDLAYPYGFNGLMKSDAAFLDAESGYSFFYAVGMSFEFNGGIPGPLLSTGQTIIVQKVELWVKQVTGAYGPFAPGSGLACHENAVCYLPVNETTVSCQCKDGYAGDGINNCDDVNECSFQSISKCHPLATCTNYDGGYTCTCPPNYFGNGTHCEPDQCALGTHNCHRNATCTKVDGSFVCECIQGYAGNGTTTCAEVNECLLPVGEGYPCHENATCANTPGSYTCTCNEGLDGDGINTCSNDLIIWLDASTFPQYGDENSTVWLDQSGNGLDANINSAYYTTNYNVSRFHYVYNTSAKFMNVPVDLGPDFYSDITIEVIFIANATYNNAWIVDTDNGGYDRSFALADNRYGGGVGQGIGSVYTTFVDTPPLQCWHYGAAVFRQNVTKGSFVFVDGFTGQKVRAVNNPSGHDLFIGGSSRNGGINGGIRLLKVYNRALTDEEIAFKYNQVEKSLHCECEKGFEGKHLIGCYDIDECDRGIDACHKHATCTNTIGDYNCTCNDGFYGDGFTCEPEANCIVSDWVATSNCSTTCGPGTRTEERYIIRPATSKGIQCPSVLSRVSGCSNDPCSMQHKVYELIISSQNADSDSFDFEDFPNTVSSFGVGYEAVLVSRQKPLNPVFAADAVVRLGKALPHDNRTYAEYRFMAPFAVSGSSVLASVENALSSDSTSWTVSTFVARTDCYCEGENLGNEAWFAAPCNTTAFKPCPFSDGFVSRFCNTTASGPGKWLEINAGECRNPLLTKFASGLPVNKTEATLHTIAAVAEHSQFMSTSDMSNALALAVKIVERRNETTEDVEFAASIVRIISSTLAASEVTSFGGVIIPDSLPGLMEEMTLNFARKLKTADSRIYFATPYIQLVAIKVNASSYTGLTSPLVDFTYSYSANCTNATACVVTSVADQPVFVPSLAEMQLPTSLIENVGDNTTSEFVIALGVYTRTGIFRSGGFSALSAVMFATVDDLRLTNGSFANGTELVFTLPAEIPDGTPEKDVVCGYWDLAEGNWFTDGCYNGTIGDGLVTCRCLHMTHFAVLDIIEPVVAAASVKAKSSSFLKAGLVISIPLLVIFLWWVSSNSKQATHRRFAHFLMAVMVMVAQIFFVFSFDKVEESSCADIASGLQFVIVALFSWTFVLAIDLRIMAGGDKNKSSTGLIVLYTILGFVPAAIVAIVTHVLIPDDLGSAYNCWLKVANMPTLLIVYFASVGFFVFAALITGMFVLLKAMTTKKYEDSMDKVSNSSIFTRLSFVFIVFVMLVLAAWVVALFGVSNELGSVWEYVFIALQTAAAVLLVFGLSPMFGVSTRLCGVPETEPDPLNYKPSPLSKSRRAVGDSTTLNFSMLQVPEEIPVVRESNVDDEGPVQETSMDEEDKTGTLKIVPHTSVRRTSEYLESGDVVENVEDMLKDAGLDAEAEEIAEFFDLNFEDDALGSFERRDSIASYDGVNYNDGNEYLELSDITLSRHGSKRVTGRPSVGDIGEAGALKARPSARARRTSKQSGSSGGDRRESSDRKGSAVSIDGVGSEPTLDMSALTSLKEEDEKTATISTKKSMRLNAPESGSLQNLHAKKDSGSNDSLTQSSGAAKSASEDAPHPMTRHLSEESISSLKSALSASSAIKEEKEVDMAIDYVATALSNWDKETANMF